MVTFWERAAYSANSMFPYNLSTFIKLFPHSVSIEGRILVLIEPIPGHFLPFYF